MALNYENIGIIYDNLYLPFIKARGWSVHKEEFLQRLKQKELFLTTDQEVKKAIFETIKECAGLYKRKRLKPVSRIRQYGGPPNTPKIG